LKRECLLIAVRSDKDQLWKDREKLRTHTEDLEESLDEVNWVRDEDVRACALCGHQFSVTNRKHHCRCESDVTGNRQLSFTGIPAPRAVSQVCINAEWS